MTGVCGRPPVVRTEVKPLRESRQKPWTIGGIGFAFTRHRSLRLRSPVLARRGEYEILDDVLDAVEVALDGSPSWGRRNNQKKVTSD